jgi:adenylate cyclase
LPSVKRKLTTIFCADVQSYGQLMARDEPGTLARLQRYRRIMDDLFARHEGRKVNTWGDAVIAEFASVVEAVRCAVEIQDAIGAENRGLKPEDRMWFRVGVNLGDVMVDGGDIYGDGVNVASRLQAVAEPGGIMISDSVHDFVRKQLAIGFDYAGEKKLKDGEEPVQAWRVRVGGANSPRPEQSGGPKSEGPQPEAAAGGMQLPPPPSEAIQKLTAYYERFRDWFSRQDRGVKVSVAFIGFFFAINLFFSGIATPWFIFPSFPFALYILLKRRRLDST